MKKFLRNVGSSSAKSDASVKNAINTQLSNSIKELQLFNMEENLSGDSMDIPDAENTLCTVIEAIFLHGLKDSLSHRFRKALVDIDSKPDINFWAPLLVISHRQTIDQINDLSQIHSEIGQCRAWIRLVLNDSLLSSYITTVQQDSSSLKPYYNKNAYLRDSELLDVTQQLIKGLEADKTFTLPCNSSLLNTWALPSLFLAGIWTVTLRSCPISSGVDVAESLQSASDVNSDTCSLASAVSEHRSNSGIGTMINEDEALKIILAKHAYDTSSTHTSDEKQTPDVSEIESSIEVPQETNLGNSLGKKSGWSSFEENVVSENTEENKQNESLSDSQGMERSFGALIESYNTFGGSFMKTPDVREVLQRFENESNAIEGLMSQIEVEEASENLSQSESNSLSAQIGKIAREKGLDFHSYECSDCKKSLNMAFRPNVCYFTGDYFCVDCIAQELIYIPANVIHNWDFNLYPVSRKSFDYIAEIKDHATIDFKTLNPYIYTVVEEMSLLLVLRNQLNYLRAYLYTCQEPIIEELKKKMWPREYMYEHVHKYSISDLTQIMDGTLVSRLQEVVDFGKQHVKSCWLCSQKGFICEVCNNSKPVYPFDIQNTYHCDTCNAVYHKGCLDSSKPCPKCERRRKREDLPLLDATIQ